MIRRAKNKYGLPLNKRDIIQPKKRLPNHSYDRKLKYAVDFLVPIGNPIFAAASGKVVWIKENSKVGGKDKKKY